MGCNWLQVLDFSQKNTKDLVGLQGIVHVLRFIWHLEMGREFYLS